MSAQLFEVEKVDGVTHVRLHVQGLGLVLPITREQLLEVLFGSDAKLLASPKKKSKAAPKAKARGPQSSASRDLISKRMKKRYAERFKSGLCAFCDKKAIDGTRYCAKHTRGGAKK